MFMNLNPFKRKDAYSFEDTELSKDDTFGNMNKNFGSNDLENETNSLNSQMGSSNTSSSDFSQMDSSSIRENHFEDDTISSSGIESSNNSNSNSFSSNPFDNNSSREKPQDNNLDDINQVVLKRIEDKIDLLDEKVNSITHKVDTLYKIIHMEISDETRKNLKIDSFKNNYR